MSDKKAQATDELRVILEGYASKGVVSYDQVTLALARDHPQITFGSQSSYYNILKQLDITPIERKHLKKEGLQTKINALKGMDARRGFRGMQHALSLQGNTYSALSVLNSLREVNPEGLVQRSLGQKRKTRRFPINMAGPNEQWSLDGHDKLSSYGFHIYGIADVFSGKVLGLAVLPSNRLVVNPHWLYLRTILSCNGIPVTVATDGGTETGLVSEMQTYIRGRLSGEELQDHPPHVVLPSKRNITIERTWRAVHAEVGGDVKNWIEAGFERSFVPTNNVHCQLFWWILAPLVQSHLNKWTLHWNTFCVRKQKDKFGPSGGSRTQFYQEPERWNGMECLLEFNGDGELKGEITELYRAAAQEAQLAWVAEGVDEICSQVLQALHLQPPTEETAWDVFSELLPLVREPIAGLLG